MAGLSAPLVQRFIETLRTCLDDAAADGILLSGGLDTSTIAAYAAQRRPPLAVTVCVPPGESIDRAHQETLASKLGCDPSAFPSPDAPYAERCARHLGLSHDVWWLTLDELLLHAPATIRAIRSFDPMQVRNGITIYCGLLRAKALGARRVYTGDGADEMYAGYSHMWTMPADQLHAYLGHMATIMRFTTPDLAAAVGIEIVSPTDRGARFSDRSWPHGSRTRRSRTRRRTMHGTTACVCVKKSSCTITGCSERSSTPSPPEQRPRAIARSPAP